MSYNLNSYNGLHRGLYRGVLYGSFKGNTRSLDYSSCGVTFLFSWAFAAGLGAIIWFFERKEGLRGVFGGGAPAHTRGCGTWPHLLLPLREV